MIGQVDIHPSTSADKHEATSLATTNINNRNIVLEFTTLGYTKFSPGVIEFRNIGVRYSGKYRLQTVTHTLDGSGYVTKGTAVSFALAAGGVTLQEAPKVPDPPNQVSVRQFKSAPSSSDPAPSTDNSQKALMEKYDQVKQLRK